MPGKVKAVPEGYHTVTPYLTVKGAGKVIEFVKKAFGAQERFRMPGPGGSVAHAEVKIGDSMIMLGDAGPQASEMPGKIHLYLDDCDRYYKQALAAGATSVRAPENQFYGDRNAAVKDAAGNEWWVSTHVEDVSPEEMQKRLAAMQKK